MESSAFFCKRTKRSRVLLRSLQKNVAFFALFYILLGLIDRQKLEKRTEKNVAFFKITERSERNRKQCPTLERETGWLPSMPTKNNNAYLTQIGYALGFLVYLLLKTILHHDALS